MDRKHPPETVESTNEHGVANAFPECVIDALTSLLSHCLKGGTLQVQLEAILCHVAALEWLGPGCEARVYLMGPDGGLDLRASSGREASPGSRHYPPLDCCMVSGLIPPGPMRCSNLSSCLWHACAKANPAENAIGWPILAFSRRLGWLVVNLGQDVNTNDATVLAFLQAVADAVAAAIERERVTDSLRKTEERFQLATEGSDTGVWDWDLRTNEVYFSARWKSQLGYSEAEISQGFEEWHSRLHPDDRETAYQKIGDYLAGRTLKYELEHRLLHRDGTYHWIIARGGVVRDEQGVPYRMVGTHLDVTEKKRLEQINRGHEIQLTAARRLQERFLPQAHPGLAGYDIQGVSHPAEHTRGDTFDYLDLPDGLLGLFVADVSGHGFDAALLMASTLARLRSYTELRLPHSEVFSRLNHALIRETEGDRFVTFLFVALDPRTGLFTYTGGGHPPLVILDATGDVKAIHASTTLPLGIIDDLEMPTAGPFSLESGDTALLLTDGLIEARSLAFEQFGLKRLLDAVRQSLDRTASGILDAMLAAVRRHTGNVPPQDDMTAVIVKAL